jgi:hypothetical protein
MIDFYESFTYTSTGTFERGDLSVAPGGLSASLQELMFTNPGK